VVTHGHTPFDATYGGDPIVGLLSTPKYLVDYVTNGYEIVPLRTNTNSVTAHVRAINGAAAEKTPATNDNDLVFSYLLTTEIAPLSPFFARDHIDYNAPILTAEQRVARSNLWVKSRTYRDNYHELRLTFQWPLIASQNGPPIVGNNQRTFRTLVSGRVLRTNDLNLNAALYFFDPATFVQLTNFVAPRF
jgi:hypothetical protein